MNGLKSGPGRGVTLPAERSAPPGMTERQHNSLDADALASVLSRAAAGDQAAWRAIVGAYAPRVFALARSRCRDAEAAEEITQSVFATVAAKFDAAEYREQGRFESWLFRIAMNRLRDMVRRQKRVGRLVGSAGVPLADVAARAEARDEGDALAKLRDALATLSDTDREVIELRHHGCLSFNQIAELLDEPLGTLLARHHRALHKLREIMEGGRALSGKKGGGSHGA